MHPKNASGVSIVKDIHFFNNFDFYDIIFEFINRYCKELIDEFIRNHVKIIVGSKLGK